MIKSLSLVYMSNSCDTKINIIRLGDGAAEKQFDLCIELNLTALFFRSLCAIMIIKCDVKTEKS